MNWLRWGIAVSIITLAVTFTATFTGSGSPSGNSTEKSEASHATVVSTSKQSPDKPLVIYFSRGINTVPSPNVDAVAGPSLKVDGTGFRSDEQTLAEWIAKETNADLFAIQTERKYPMGYDDILEAGKSEKIKDARPALSSRLENLQDYQTIYFVYPNWWGDLPMPVYSFFDEYDFTGKKIIAVIISGGGGFAGTISYIQKLEPNADVIEGIEIYKKDMDRARERIVSWIRHKK